MLQIDRFTRDQYVRRAQLVRVIDGDTFDFDIDLGFEVWAHKQRVRLRGVDAQERYTEKGIQTTLWMQEVLEAASNAGTLFVRSHEKQLRDGFRRWLCDVYIGDAGMDLADAAIKAGRLVPWNG